MKWIWRLLIPLLVSLTTLLLIGCAAWISNEAETTITDAEKARQEAEKQMNMSEFSAIKSSEAAMGLLVEPEPYMQRITLSAVGDIMMHMPQITSGYQPEQGNYQFSYFFERVKPIIQHADIAVGNLETTLAGEDLTFSGYPEFNAPKELAAALAETGFDVITTANNHSLDRREKGVFRTIESLKEQQLAHTGTFRSADERKQVLMIEENEIKVAFLAYTYGTNGIPVPEGKPYLVNLLDREVVHSDILQARQQGADIIVCSLHFGNEYQRVPSPEQIEWVNQLLAWGVDVILGSHPHVVQPFEIKQAMTENGQKKQAAVIYSLGNFISAQKGDYKDIGVIFSVEIEKSFPAGDTTIEAVEVHPTYVEKYTENGRSRYRVLLLSEMIGQETLNQEMMDHIHSRMEKQEAPEEKAAS